MTKELKLRIRKIRDAQKLTQEEVAEKCGMSASAFGQIERNPAKSNYETLLKVAIALNVSILFLLDVDSSDFLEKK